MTRCIFKELCWVLCSPIKYYVIKLGTASHTFGNNVKITSFPVLIYK